MWAALSPHHPVFPHLRPRRSLADYRGSPVRALSVPADSVYPETLSTVVNLQLPHVAKVYACEPFEHSGRQYCAVLQEGHTKTLQEEVTCRMQRNLPFSGEELEFLLKTLLETLKALFEHGFCYFIEANKVLFCPISHSQGTFAVKIGHIWSCFRPNPSDLAISILQSLECLRMLSNYLVSYFPTAACPSFDHILSEMESKARLLAANPPQEEQKLEETGEKEGQSDILTNADTRTKAATSKYGQSRATLLENAMKSWKTPVIEKNISPSSSKPCKVCQCSLF